MSGETPKTNWPIIGFLAAALSDREAAPLAVLALVAVLGIALVALFGYPALILLVLAAAFGSLGMLIVLTRAS